MIAPALLALLGFQAAAVGPGPGDALAVFPPTITLAGPLDSQKVIVEAMGGADPVADVTSGAVLRVDDPRIAGVESGVVVPKGDGRTTLVATLGDRSARVPVEVTGFGEIRPRSFRNDVIPVLTRSGCNMGACHGAAAGKNGLRLTLRGYGPELDHDALTRQVSGRRIDRTSPKRA